MKHFAALAFAALALAVAGCGQPKFQTESLTWWDGYTNLELTITYKHVLTTTNVDTLEEAANILGQYGWQLATVNGSDANRVMYLKRQYRGDDECTFALTPSN